MKLSEFKDALSQLDKVAFVLPDGKNVPKHFHVTEVGKSTKSFMDCDGVLRNEESITIQLWTSIDLHHRLRAEKLKGIVDLAEERLQLNDSEIFVEYQGTTLETYALTLDGSRFRLLPTHTDCLAKEACGITLDKPKRALRELQTSCCEPSSGCC